MSLVLVSRTVVVVVNVVVVVVVVVVCPGIQGNCGCWSWYPGPLWLFVLVSRAIVV